MKLKVFAGNASTSLAQSICNHLSIPFGKAMVSSFNDGEVRIQYLEDVRNADVFIVNSTHPPAENYLELCIMADAARSASAERITAVIPYWGYARQDRKDRPRVPVSARLLAQLLSETGIDRVLIIDIHSEPSLFFFKKRVVVDHLYGSTVMIPYLEKLLEGKEFVVASPDKGGGPRAEKYARFLGQDDYVIFNKTRAEAGVIKENSVKIIGDIAGKDVLFVDDMADTCGTLVTDAVAAKVAGANSIYACVTHAVLSGEALSKIAESNIDELIITDTISFQEKSLRKKSKGKIRQLTVAPFLARAIRKIHEGESLSSLIV